MVNLNGNITSNSFTETILSGKIYVDKSQAALKLIQQNRLAFAEARSGSGKSLLLDTIEAMFKQEYRLFKNLHTTIELAYLPYVRVVRMDGAFWTNKSDNYLYQLQQSLKSGNVVLLFDNLHLLKNTEPDGFKSPSVQNLLALLEKYIGQIRLAVFLTDEGHITASDKALFSSFQNITNEDYMKKVFHFSKDEVTHYFSDELNEIAEDMDLNTNDLFEHLQQYYGASCCKGLSPRGVLQFFAS